MNHSENLACLSHLCRVQHHPLANGYHAAHVWNTSYSSHDHAVMVYHGNSVHFAQELGKRFFDDDFEALQRGSVEYTFVDTRWLMIE